MPGCVLKHDALQFGFFDTAVKISSRSVMTDVLSSADADDVVLAHGLILRSSTYNGKPAGGMASTSSVTSPVSITEAV